MTLLSPPRLTSGTTVSVRGAQLGNRFAGTAHEGWDGTPEGLPSQLTERRWQRFGESGPS
jgi:hypothetical protein